MLLAGAALPALAQDVEPALDYDTARLERRLNAVRAAGPMTLDGTLDEPSWSGAPLASHFIQNDPREGDPATYDETAYQETEQL